MRQMFAMMMFAAVTAMTLSQTAAAQTTQWQLDKPHTMAVFKIGHLDVSHTWGRFNNIEGSYATGDQPRFDFTVAADSIDTGNQKRDDHLRSADFFNVKQYPQITFKTTDAQPIEGGYEVTGDLTLHGVTKTITVNVMKVGEGEDPWGNYRSGYDSNFTIKRSDFGMDNMLNAVGDEVQLFVSFEGLRQ
jgi:polyisoprenoid-binding protein YceI